MTVNDAIKKINDATGSDKANLVLSIGLDKKDEAISYIKVITECDNVTASQTYEKLHQESLDKRKRNEETQQQKYIPRCPTCGSPSVIKIPDSKRWFSVGMFGMASSDVGKTMKCNNCGYKW